LDLLGEGLQTSIAELRRFCYELRPPSLVHFGLEQAIHSHAEIFTRKFPHLDLNLKLASDHQLLPESVRVAMFRIYQEALSNVVKHAKATRVQVSLWLDDREIVLEIQDDGIGFQLPEDWVILARQGHLGLVGMQERAEAIGGAVQVESAPGQGARIRVRIPVGEGEGQAKAGKSSEGR
jgi:signal transduction histidine kinase